MHNYEVPVFVNGHGFMVRLEGEVIKNGLRLQPVAHDDEKTLTSEAQLNNNEILLKLQAAKKFKLTPEVENSKILTITDENLNSLQSLDEKGVLLNAIRKLNIAENFEALTDSIGKYFINY